MITINNVEYKDNLKLKAVTKKYTTFPSSISVSSTDNYNNIFIYQNKLCIYTNKFFYYYNGDEWVKFDSSSAPSNSSSYSSDYRLLIYNDNIYMIGRSSSYPKCFRISFDPYTWNELGSITYSNYGSGTKIMDLCVVNNDIYALLQYNSSDINSVHLCKFNLSTLSFTEIYDFSSFYPIEYSTYKYRRMAKLLCYNNNLYLINTVLYNTNSINGLPIPSLYKLQNSSIIEVSQLPMVCLAVSTSYIPNVFVFNNSLYCCPRIYYSSSSGYVEYNTANIPYIWKYDDENNEWNIDIRFPYGNILGKYMGDCLKQDFKYLYTTNSAFANNFNDYTLIEYNGSIHALNSSTHYIYNEELHDWYKAGYWICKIDDSNTITTTT